MIQQEKQYLKALKYFYKNKSKEIIANTFDVSEENFILKIGGYDLINNLIELKYINSNTPGFTYEKQKCINGSILSITNEGECKLKDLIKDKNKWIRIIAFPVISALIGSGIIYIVKCWKEKYQSGPLYNKEIDGKAPKDTMQAKTLLIDSLQLNNK